MNLQIFRVVLTAMFLLSAIRLGTLKVEPIAAKKIPVEKTLASEFPEEEVPEIPTDPNIENISVRPFYGVAEFNGVLYLNQREARFKIGFPEYNLEDQLLSGIARSVFKKYSQCSVCKFTWQREAVGGDDRLLTVYIRTPRGAKKSSVHYLSWGEEPF